MRARRPTSRVDPIRLPCGDGDVLGECAVALRAERPVGERPRGIRGAHHRPDDHPLADPGGVDRLADANDPAAAVGALDPRERERHARPAAVVPAPALRGGVCRSRPDGLRVPAEARVDVRVVDAGGGDADEHVVASEHRQGHVLPVGEAVDVAVARQHDGTHARGEPVQARHPRSRRHRSGLTSAIRSKSRSTWTTPSPLWRAVSAIRRSGIAVRCHMP